MKSAMATSPPPPQGWSELAPDALSLVYKRLSFADFARAKTVCSSWYAVSRSSSPRKNHVPWLIFKQNMNWRLFNPEEGKFYRTQINQLGFTNCRSVATCGNWVLVTDEKAYIYIINPFTLEMIDLPPLRSHHTSEYKRLGNYSFHLDYGFRQIRPIRVDYAVLWVDERSKDYLVVWTTWDSDRLSFCRKGYEEWLETPRCEHLGKDECMDLAYKDKRLYILLDDYGSSMRILDFSTEYPKEVTNHPYIHRRCKSNNYYFRTRMKLTTSGHVLMIRRVRDLCCLKFWFEVYKMNSSDEEWERVDSLEEEEALVWDLSVTLPTKGVSGIKKDFIYFCDTGKESSTLKAITYEIPTQRIEHFEQYNQLLGVKDARWFLPCFAVGE